MSRWLVAARAAVRGWTWCYTSAVPEPHRTARRAELAADLHDHLADLAERNIAGPAAAFEIVRRVVAGLTDDVAWAASPGGTEENMTDRIQALALMGWATAVVLAVLNLLGALAGLQDGWRELGEHWWSTLAALGIGAAAAGLCVTVAVLRTAPHRP